MTRPSALSFGRALSLAVVGVLAGCGQRTGEVALPVAVDPIAGLTTMPHAVPPHVPLPLPLGEEIVLRASLPDGVNLSWEGAAPLAGTRDAATFHARSPGMHEVVVRTSAGCRTLRLEVVPVAKADIRLRLCGAPPAAHRGGRVELGAVTEPPQFAALVEWHAPGMSPSSGSGATFTATVPSSLPANAPPPQITSRLGTNRNVGVQPVLYTVRFVVKPTRTNYFQATPTIRLYHEVVTDPPGYEAHVPWTYDTTGTATASATTGMGRSFTTVRTNNREHPLLCWRVTAGDAHDAGDLVNQLLRTPLQQREEQPPKNRACSPPDPASHSLPITLSNGEATLAVVDLRVPSRGFDFVWQRTYSSRADFRGTLGWGWTHNYDRRLYVIPGSTTVTLSDGAGREDFYQPATNGRYVSAAGYYDALTRNPDGTFTQLDADGTTYSYDGFGCLVAITDRTRANTLRIVRNSFCNILEIADTQDRVYSFRYDNNSSSQLLRAVTDFRGRTVEYEYTASQDLIAVRSPRVLDTPTGNDFPDGKKTLYTYSSAFVDNRLNHNLLSVIEPLYNVNDDPLQSRAMVTLTYATTRDPRVLEFDRVISERWGHDQGGPPSNPTLRVGGTSSFTYSRDLSGDPDAPPSATSRTIEITRNGNIRAHYFDRGMHEVRTVLRTNRNVRSGEGDYSTDYTYTAEGLLASVTHPRGNRTRYLYDESNPRRQAQRNLLEVRQQEGAVGTLTDLVTRMTYEPVFQQLRTTTDARAFPTGIVPLDGQGRLDLGNALVARYTTTRVFDYQEGTGFQAARGIAVTDRVPEGLGDRNNAPDHDAGNVVEIVYPTIQTPGPDLGQTSAERRTWNVHGQLLTRVDPEGKVEQLEYYASNGRARDPSDFEGYVRARTVDAGALNLRTEMFYDTSGNVVATLDPKGQRSDFVLNELNQIVRALSRPVAMGSFRYRVDTHYDKNDNVVRREALNLDENGAPYAHTTVVQTVEYDILHNVLAVEKDKTRNDRTQAGRVRTEFTYDAHTNRIATRRPTPTAARPVTIATVRYDERELPFQTIAGDDDLDPNNPPPATAVIATRNYDANGNVLEDIDQVAHSVRGGPAPRFPGTAPGDVVQHTYDGFDRVTETRDGEGQRTSFAYDRASNRTGVERFGPIDHTPSAPQRVLLRTLSDVDERDRTVRTRTLHVDANGNAVGDGESTTTYRYDREGKVVEVSDDRGLAMRTIWDGADRQQITRDALNNEVELAYDLNSNVRTVTAREVSSDYGSPPETFVTTNDYDGVDRLIATTDPIGTVRRFDYDARGNVVRTRDGVTGGGANGNVVRHEHDALDRLVRSERLLTSNGRGNGAPAGSIVTTQSWDDDSLLLGQTDANAHTTAYGYDRNGRLVTLSYADGTVRSTLYDRDDHVAQWTDQNGTACGNVYDGVGRLVRRNVSRGAGVLGATFERFGFDGANRTTLVESDSVLGAGLLTCEFRYDSLSLRTVDTQGSYTVASVYDGVGNRTSCTYPGSFGGGARTLTNGFDNLNRLRNISDGAGSLATWHYKGPSRLERRTYGVDTTPLLKLDCAYDAVPRLVVADHTDNAASRRAGFHYGHDREHHRLFEKRLHEASRGDVFAYDSIYRVVRSDRAVDLSTVPPGTEITPETFASPDHQRYLFDGAGNRQTTIASVAGIPTTTTWVQVAGGAIRDAEVNQYTSRTAGTSPTESFTWDHNGNLTSDGRFRYAHDFKNRLVEVRDFTTNAVIARYAFDAADRRSMKVLDPDGVPTTRVYVYDGEQVVEERSGAGALQRQHVWGDGVDELLQARTGSTPAQTFYACENASGSIHALVDGSGAVVERYDYDAFGTTTVTLNGGTGNEYRFEACRVDPETGLYWMRARHYAPDLGRFIQRDPIGIWTDAVNLGNGFTFVGNDAVNGRDPSGLADWWEIWEEAKWWGRVIGGTAGGTASDIGTGIYNTVRHPFDTARAIDCGVRGAFHRAGERGRLVTEQSGSVLGGLAQYFGSLGGDLTGVNRLGEAIYGVDFDDFARSGNWDELDSWERWRRGLAGGGQLATEMFGPLAGAQAVRQRANASVPQDLRNHAAGDAARGTSSILNRTPQSLQKFFTKHGDDFGLQGNWNPSRAADASRAIHQHINSPATRAIEGTYRGNPAVHYLDPTSGLNVSVLPVRVSDLIVCAS